MWKANGKWQIGNIFWFSIKKKEANDIFFRSCAIRVWVPFECMHPFYLKSILGNVFMTIAQRSRTRQTTTATATTIEMKIGFTWMLGYILGHEFRIANQSNDANNVHTNT